MVAISIKIHRLSLIRHVTILIAVASFFVVCIFARFIKFHPLPSQIVRQGPTSPTVQILIHPSSCEKGPTTSNKRTQIIIHPSSCDEGPTPNISTTSLSTPTSERRRGDYPHYHHISQIVEGPALTATNFENAICKFRWIKYSHHFPHTMQQLYRCWSWWIAHPEKQPILIFHHTLRTLRNTFVIQFFKVLQKQIKLKIVRYHKGPYVQAKDTGMWDYDIELTDYAMFDPERKLRQVFAAYIQKNLPNPPYDPKSLDTHQSPKIAILNRATTTGRSLLNAKELANSIEDTFPGQTVPIVYFEEKPMLEQVNFFMETDIIISPHGAQLTSIAFMKNCSTIVEFFPQDYLAADFFGSLAASVGVNHKFFYLGYNETHIQPYERYHYVPTVDHRESNLCPNMGTVMAALVDLIQSWRPCCSAIPSTSTTTLQRHQTNKLLTATHPIIDIAVGSLFRKTQLDAQKQTFGLHPTVRNFFPIMEFNDTNESCFTNLRFEQYQKIISSCPSKKYRTKLLQLNNSTEWLCAQKRAIGGLNIVIEKYKSRTLTIPDYLILIDDDTYLNMDALVKTFQESYSCDDNHLLAGCTFRQRRSHFIFPVAGLGKFFTRATIEKIIKPIHCQNDSQGMDPFVEWTCWRLDQNLVGEKQFFREGMSVGDLMFAYASRLLYTGLHEWGATGYCFHSDHALAYFLNYYHVSVPDWLLNETNPTDTVRKTFSFRKIAGGMETGNGRGMYRGSECGNVFNKCTAESRVCHYLTSEQMKVMYRRHRSNISM